ncbi:DNA polymerase III subunit delta', partial [Mycoplasmopsis pullorum]
NSKSYKDFTQEFIEVLDFALYENIYKLASFLNEHIEKNSIKSEFVIEFLILFAKIEIFQNKKTEENKYFKSLFGLFENYKDAE